MKIATIVPVDYMHLEDWNDYHMALAHLVPKSNRYADWFLDKSYRGDHVIMDNGVVETGIPLRMTEVWEHAKRIRASEIILPDTICDRASTLGMGNSAMATLSFLQLREVDPLDYVPRLMSVPQGISTSEWMKCLEMMLDWPVDTIGFSKFMVIQGGWKSRVDALHAMSDEILGAGKQIHLLGSPLGSNEVQEVRSAFPGVVRGLDSGYPTINAANYCHVSEDGKRADPKQADEVDFLHCEMVPIELMLANYKTWVEWTRGQ